MPTPEAIPTAASLDWLSTPRTANGTRPLKVPARLTAGTILEMSEMSVTPPLSSDSLLSTLAVTVVSDSFSTRFCEVITTSSSWSLLAGLASAAMAGAAA